MGVWLNFCLLCPTIILWCNRDSQQLVTDSSAYMSSAYKTIGDIATPAGFERAPVDKNSFGDWLRRIKLKKDSKVYLYNGALKDDQSSHFAVLDIPVSKSDLQQCADAIMRLRAEYFFAPGRIDSIFFNATDGTLLSFPRWLAGERYKLVSGKLRPFTTMKVSTDKRQQLERFLEVVFTYCGTISLDRELRGVVQHENIAPGDVFVTAGSPGHAMIVVDVAANEKGERVFMLAQSFMPAQSVHIVRNLNDRQRDPWYTFNTDSKIVTPGWVFYKTQLKHW